MYVYIKSEANLYTVGFYEGGHWHAESDFATADKAAERVHYLNGGSRRHDDRRKQRAQEQPPKAKTTEIDANAWDGTYKHPDDD